jgi:hypothetical protein
MNHCNKIIKGVVVHPGTHDFQTRKKQHILRSCDYLANKKKVAAVGQNMAKLEASCPVV